jgi:imidazole glycerol-phosphate synthase subunit HisH
MPATSSAPRIAVIDYGIGNLRSAEKALQKAGADAFLTDNVRDIETAEAVVLPGVGAMGRCMEALADSGLQNVAVDAALEAATSGRPFLGVCVGMQMLHAGSTEHGGVDGLGLFQSTVTEIHPASGPNGSLKVPHMQWNKLDFNKPSVLRNESTNVDPQWVYFVHSFGAQPHPDVVATAEYGGAITAVVERGHLMGTQFHPEKSGVHGLAILRRFIALCRS